MAKRTTDDREFGLQGESRSPAPTMGKRAQRTSALIQDKARDVFLAKGYFGARIDDIAEAAGMSRGSFYTYFPAKRDVLLSLGVATHEAGTQVFATMLELAESGHPDALAVVVKAYLEYLDEHGAFISVWAQAAAEDDELRSAGMRSRMVSANNFADVMRKLGWSPAPELDAGHVALALLGTIDRHWYYWRVSGLRATDEKVVGTLVAIIGATLSH